MVAKSFQQFEQIGEPFEVSGRKYVIVKNPKTGTERTVRWYTEKEYNKMYPDVPVAVPTVEKKPWLKKSLGFEKGYITIFTNTEENEEWFSRSNARWHGSWGWYIVSTEEVPSDLPDGVAAFHLYWKDIIIEEGVLKPKDIIKAHVSKILHSEEVSNSEHSGSIGERLSLTLTVYKTTATMSSYGPKITYYMKDEKDNKYKWFTSPRQFQKGETKKMRGTVKSHIIENNDKITVLTRCMEVK